MIHSPPDSGGFMEASPVGHSFPLCGGTVSRYDTLAIEHLFGLAVDVHVALMRAVDLLLRRSLVILRAKGGAHSGGIRQNVSGQTGFPSGSNASCP